MPVDEGNNNVECDLKLLERLSKSPEKKHRLTKTESENTSSLGGKQNDDAEGKSTLKEDENGESQDEEMSHTVTLSILIALAFPPPSPANLRILDELIKNGKKTLDAPKPVYYFHVEYELLPTLGLTECDIVTYATGAKIFTGDDSKMTRTWFDGSMMWVTWEMEHTFEVSEPVAALLHEHKVLVKICNGKDTISKKTFNDKPKALRIPFPADSDSVRGLVYKVSSVWLNNQPKQKSSIGSGLSHSASKHALLDNSRESEDEPAKYQTSLALLAGIYHNEAISPDMKMKGDKSNSKLRLKQEALKKELSKAHSGMNSIMKTFKNSKTSLTETVKTEVEQFGHIEVNFKYEHLFTGERNVTFRCDSPFRPMCDAYVQVSLDKNLLPSGLERKLNPMIVTLRSVKNLPCNPSSYEKLDEDCLPVYCKYNFMDGDFVTTAGKNHSPNVYFDDTRVFFLGKYDQAELRQYIQQNKFKIYVHDRDQREKEIKQEACLFGEEYTDYNVSGSKKRAKNTKKTQKLSQRKVNEKNSVDKSSAVESLMPDLNFFAYHGVATVRLNELLQGRTKLYCETTVLPSGSPEFTGKLMRNFRREKSKVQSTSAGCDVTSMKLCAMERKLASMPLPCGEFISNGTHVKVQVKVCRPLVAGWEKWQRMLPENEQKDVFGRIVLMFEYNNKEFLNKLDKYITNVNARALNLHHFDYNIAEAALNTYKLTDEEKASKTLDILTGFHLIDGQIHLFVLEGLQNSAIKNLLSDVPREKSNENERMIEVHDSSITYNKRIYEKLDVNLTRIRLYQSLSNVVRQPLLYVRDILPKPCLDCLLKLDQMTKMHRLRNMTSSGVFPSYEMIHSLNEELGVAVTYEDFEDHQVDDTGTSESKTSYEEVHLKSILKKKKSADYEYSVEMQKSLAHFQANKPALNHIENNINEVRRISIANSLKSNKFKNKLTFVHDGGSHIYSSQKRNTNELSKNMMKKFLKNLDPKSRFAYSKDFNSSIVEPDNHDEVRNVAEKAARRRWKTQHGFKIPLKLEGKPQLHESRLEELKLAFRDNLLHSNKLQPTLQWRSHTEWNKPKEMKKYVGKTKHNYQKSLFSDEPFIDKNKNEKKDESKFVVGNPRMQFYLKNKQKRARHADKMEQILKDAPMTASLKKYPAVTLPPISVIHTTFEGDKKKSPPNSGYTIGPRNDIPAELPGNHLRIPMVTKHQPPMRLIFANNEVLTRGFQIKHGSQDFPQFSNEKILTSPELSNELMRRAAMIRQKESEDISKQASEYRIRYQPEPDDCRRNPIPPKHMFAGF